MSSHAKPPVRPHRDTDERTPDAHGPEAETPAELQACAAQQYRHSLDQLFAEHRHELTGFLVRQLGSHELAEDISHEVYLRLRLTGDWPANPRAWLFRIARNLIIDHHRHQSRAPEFESVSEGDERVAAAHLDPERSLARRQKLQVVDAALSELAGHFRLALTWYRLEGLTKREIGERLGVSERMAGRYVTQAQQHCEMRLAAAGCYRNEVSRDCAASQQDTTNSPPAVRQTSTAPGKARRRSRRDDAPTARGDQH
ncbi:RNA polymerase sigma factor [Cobetia sp. 4B]|uniref:RNA polymerase sigma factor n=1 Tax=Cobetia sp. 4B TaxID=2758724 RepID=UPI001C05AB58|nr:RNA polymerase sigma factor [Cobetia sp. 4B]MBR9754783.1 RNA polymerase sigma factor [Gammaproteobacteria bacterium]QWN37358.1 RNA polymerase sigma factor [Cobetia sp. 4B]